MAFERNYRRREEEPAPEWVPRTEIGLRVKSGEITSLEQIFEMGKKPLEIEIIEKLIPNLSEEVLSVSTTQRTTDCGRKMQFRAIVAVGDGNGHIGIGAGKNVEAKPAIDSAIKDAKKHLISVGLGCGSWECLCGGQHTVPIKIIGRSGSVTVTLMPGPKGLGIAAHKVVRTVLRLAGVKDVWSYTDGRTSMTYNTAMATRDALEKLNYIKNRGVI